MVGVVLAALFMGAAAQQVRAVNGSLLMEVGGGNIKICIYFYFFLLARVYRAHQNELYGVCWKKVTLEKCAWAILFARYCFALCK